MYHTGVQEKQNYISHPSVVLKKHKSKEQQ